MPPRQRRFLLCTGDVVNADEVHRFGDHHIVGELVTRKLESLDVTAFRVWLVPTSCRRVPPIEPEFVADVFDGRSIRCRYLFCGRVVNWYASRSVVDASFKRLMMRYGKEKDER